MAVTVICIAQSCQRKMEKVKTGLKVKVSDDYCMHADLFKCPYCGVEVLSDTGKPHPDQFPDVWDYDIRR